MTRTGGRFGVLLALAVGTLAPLGMGSCGGSGAVTKARELPPADPEAVRRFISGVRMMKRGRARPAAARFRAALAVDGTLWEAQYNLGVLARERGEVREAITRFQAALEVQPSAREPRLALAESQYTLGQREKASKALEALIQEDASMLEARVALAVILRERGEYDDALEQAREVLVREPGHVRALTEVGRVYLEKKQHDVAMLVFRKALDLADPKERVVRARIRNDMGLLELARGDTQAAFLEFGRAIELDAAFAPARMNQGSVLIRAGDYAGAAAEYRAVLAADPGYVVARVALGAALRGMGKHEEAERQYSRALRDLPNHPDALFNMAILEAEFLDRRSKARGRFQRFLEVAPEDHPKRELAERYVKEIPAPGAR